MKSLAALSVILALLAGGAATLAAESDAPPAPQQAPPVAEKAFLGVQVDTTGPGKFDPGVQVSGVVTGSTAAVMGILPNDLITAINGHPITKMDELGDILKGLQVGSAVSIAVQRKGEKLTLTGSMSSKPAPPESQRQQFGRLQAEVERLKKHQNRPPDMAETLDDVLTQLNQLKRDLPKAAEDFKKQYPNGTFQVKIEINITSDATAKDPLKLGDKTEASSQTPAPATPAPLAPPAATPTPAPAPSPHTP